ncbi:MAG: putative porin [Bacteroidota bacterium]
MRPRLILFRDDIDSLPNTVNVDLRPLPSRLLMLPLCQRPLAALAFTFVFSVPFGRMSGAPAAEHSAGQSPADSIAAGRDTTAAPDTTRMTSPSLVGSLDRHIDPPSYRTRENLHWLDYRYAGDILATFPGAYVRDQHSEGQYSQLTFGGSDWRSIAVLMNGRLMNDPASGIYNLYGITPEYADRIEVVSGPRAFLYALNSAGGSVNIVTKNYNSNKPFTKLDYSEGAYGYAYTDGTFSQNISRHVNLTFGFQHQATDGRYANSVYDGWNARSKIRIALSPDLNVILAHYYTSTQTGLNGGVDLIASGSSRAFDRIQTVVKNTDSYEKISRHDLDLSIVGTFMGDTANVTSLTLYYSGFLRQYRDEENRPFPNGVFISSDHASSWMGLHFTQNLQSEFHRLDAGASLELRQVEGSPNLGRIRRTTGAVWVKEELLPGSPWSLAGFGRYQRYRDRDYVGLGADGTLRLFEGLSVFGGLSISRRVPTFQELFWVDSTVARTVKPVAETHRVAEAGIALDAGPAGGLRISFFHRTVVDPITISPLTGLSSPFPALRFGNGAALFSNGISARVDLRFWYIAVEGTAQYLLRTSGGERLDDYPKLAGSGGVYFWHRLLKDRLELKAGFKGSFAFAHEGLAFNPEVIAYVPSVGPALGTTGTVDFFLIAHIGDAYVHFMWENLPDVRWYGTPYYPAGERALRFGIAWEFMN